MFVYCTDYNTDRQLQRVSTNYVGVASMTFLLYDHILTFNDEVDKSIIRSNSNHLDRCSTKVAYIWRRRKGLSEFVLLRSISIASETFSVGSLFLIVSDEYPLVLQCLIFKNRIVISLRLASS